MKIIKKLEGEQLFETIRFVGQLMVHKAMEIDGSHDLELELAELRHSIMASHTDEFVILLLRGCEDDE